MTVETPVMAKNTGLPEGDQFGMTQWVLIDLAAITAPTNRAPGGIKDHGGHRDFPPRPGPFSQAQQPLHPLLVCGLHQQ